MRKRFTVQVDSNMTWKELYWKDGFRLHYFFQDILDSKKAKIAFFGDGLLWGRLLPEQKEKYRKEAARIIFTDRRGRRIDESLPKNSISSTLKRLFQSSDNMEKGVDGRLVAILRDKRQNKIAGVCMFEKTENSNEAEFYFWRSARTDKADFRKAVKKLMTWSESALGYEKLTIQIEKEIKGKQYGNKAAIVFAKKLGFEEDEALPADVSRGKKETLVLVARKKALQQPAP